MMTDRPPVQWWDHPLPSLDVRLRGHPVLGGHVIRWVFDRDRVTSEVQCQEPGWADCRAVADCACEEWVVERDQQGPFHTTDDETVHRMRDGGDCSVVTWLEETGVEDSSEPGQVVPLGVTRVTAVYTAGVGYQWKAVGS